MAESADLGPGTMIVNRFWEEVVNNGYLERIDDLFAPGYILHHLPTRRDFHRDTAHPFNRSSFKELIEWFINVFPGVRVIVNEHLLVADDLVVTRLTFRAPSAANPSQHVDLPVISTSRIMEGLIHESWLVWEPLRAEEEFQTSEIEGFWIWPLRWW